MLLNFLSDKIQFLLKASRLYIAYSGGVDSHVLLHCCAQYSELRPKIIAIYVHHGLQPLAESWGQHCEFQARQLGVAFQLLRVNAKAERGQSPEEAARIARYQSVTNLLAENDLLLVAQHQDDQLETVLLQLIRGAGVQGLAAMPEITLFGRGQLFRPLLTIPKTALIEYAVEQQLKWVEDPTNQKDEFDRNFLRHQIIPVLKNRWQSVAKTVSRSAKHCANAQQLLSEMGDNLLASVLNIEDHTLSIRHLQYLSAPKQQLVIRHWFNYHSLRMPSTALVRDLFQQLIFAKTDANPVLITAQCEIRRYQDKIYCLPRVDNSLSIEPLIWHNPFESLSLSDGSQLQLQLSRYGIAKSYWQSEIVQIQFRKGGEKIRLFGRQGRHSLKKLFQEANIPNWQRSQIPLIYIGDQLAAVGDLWLNADLIDINADLAYQIQWNRLINSD